jgi:hypothetical protein
MQRLRKDLPHLGRNIRGCLPGAQQPPTPHPKQTLTLSSLKTVHLPDGRSNPKILERGEDWRRESLG